MSNIVDKIKSNPENKTIFSYLGIEPTEAYIKPYEGEAFGYRLEGGDYFDNTLPADTKYIINSDGIYANPKTGEIFGLISVMSIAFKLNKHDKSKGSLPSLRWTFLRHYKFKNCLKLSLRYFSNIWGDDNTVMDIRQLGKHWALDIYFVGKFEDKLKEFI